MRLQRRAIPILAVLLLIGCIHKTNGAKVTPRERIATDNALFATLNSAVEQGTEAVVTAKLLTPAQAAPVIGFTGQVANAHLQVTAIIEKGVAVSPSDYVTVQALFDQLKVSGTALVMSGALGIKNPNTEQTIANDIQAVLNLSQTLLTELSVIKGGV